jgi:hypothetical protein
VFFVALFVIGVLSSAGGSEDAPDAAAPAPRAMTSRQQIRDPNYIAVHRSITRAWNERIRDAVIAMAAAYRSRDFGNLYMIAGLIHDPTNDPRVGVWATRSASDIDGRIMALDEVARSIAHWPAASTTDSAITTAAHGVAEARECLRAEQAH